MVTARVTLKKARSYNFRGQRWLKDVPRVVRGEGEVEEYQNNGFFQVTMLKDTRKKKVRSVKSSADEGEETTSTKKTKKASSLKKRS